MNIDKIKQKILKKMSEEELNTKINDIIQEHGGLIGEDAAINTIARDIGINIEEEYEEEECKFLIKDISEGQSNVEITGKIIDMSDLREFSRKDGTTGMVRSIVIADNTGTVRLTLWNDKTNIADELEIGGVVEITGAFSRQWNNRIELNSGSDTKIEKIEIGDYDESMYPIVKDCYKISELQPNNPATIKGEITICYGVREFPKRNGETGKVKSFILKDDTGTIRGTLWDDNTEINLNKGDIVEVKGMVKEGFREGLDINVNTIKIIGKAEVEEIEVKDETIENLPNCNGEIVNVKGRIINISNPKTVNFGDRDVEVQEIAITDSTGTIGVAFWGNAMSKIKEASIKEGDGVKITNCKVKTYENYEGKIIASLSAQYDTEIIKDESVGAPEYSENIIKIKDIFSLDEEAKKDVSVIGKVSDLYDLRTFERRNGSTGKVRSLMLEDETGKIRLTLWDSDAELKIKEDDIIKVVRGYVKENGDYYDLNIGRIGKLIINPEGIVVEIKTNRKFIKELQEGDTTEIRGAVVDYRKQDLVLYLCPNCNKRVALVEGVYDCEECGEVSPKELITATITVDDGTSNISCKLYGSAVAKLTNTPLNKLKDANLDILENILGSEFVFSGLAKTGYNELEFSVRNVKPMDLDKEIELLKEL